MRSFTRNVLRPIALTLTFCTVTAVAFAGDWTVIDVSNNDDGTFTAILNDGEEDHYVFVKGNTRKRAKKNGEIVADALNTESCFDPCVMRPEDCENGLSSTTSTSQQWNVVDDYPSGSGWIVVVLDTDGQGFKLRRTTEAAALSYGQSLADTFNAGQCFVF